MKIKKAFALVALPALGLALTSCGPKVENYGEDIVDLYNEAADELLACENGSDVDDAVEEIEALTEDAEKLTDEIDADINKMRDEVYEDLTFEEMDEISYAYRKNLYIAKAKLQDGKTTAQKAGDTEKLEKALRKFEAQMQKAEDNLDSGNKKK